MVRQTSIGSHLTPAARHTECQLLLGLRRLERRAQGAGAGIYLIGSLVRNRSQDGSIEECFYFGGSVEGWVKVLQCKDNPCTHRGSQENADKTIHQKRFAWQARDARPLRDGHVENALGVESV